MVHQYGEHFEKQDYVYDGSKKGKKKCTAKDYWLNQISGYNESCRQTFPVALDIYSVLEKNLKSKNEKALSLVESTLDHVGTQGLWVMDRDYDGGIILNSFLSRKLNFVVRMKKNRNLLVEEESVNIAKAGGGIIRRSKFDKHSRFGSLKCHLKLDEREYEVTLICFKNKGNKLPILFLTNGWIKSTKELKRRIRGYSRRWGVEESYRFEKQGFGIEKATVRKYDRIKTLIGISLASWLLLVKIDDGPKVREFALKKAKMAKDKPKRRPHFIYYRLLMGVQKIFSGCEELFRFRWNKKKKNQYLKELKSQGMLFASEIQELCWLEMAA